MSVCSSHFIFEGVLYIGVEKLIEDCVAISVVEDTRFGLMRAWLRESCLPAEAR